MEQKRTHALAWTACAFTLIAGLTTACLNPIIGTGGTGRPNGNPIDTHDLNVKWRKSGWRFLLPGARDEPNFGLYSYVLWAEPPSAARAPAFLKTIESIVETTVKVPNEGSRSTRSLNVITFPVTEPPYVGGKPKKIAADMFEHYDTTRGAQFLQLLSNRPLTRGPYICSTTSPLTSATNLDHYLFQDLSVVEPEAIPTYIRTFKEQAAKTEFWVPDRMEQFADGLRNALAVLSQGGRRFAQAIQALGYFEFSGRRSAT